MGSVAELMSWHLREKKKFQLRKRIYLEHKNIGGAFAGVAVGGNA